MYIYIYIYIYIYPICPFPVAAEGLGIRHGAGVTGAAGVLTIAIISSICLYCKAIVVISSYSWVFLILSHSLFLW